MKSEIPFTTKISLGDLSKWSSWPARLLGLEQWKQINRTIQKTEEEYNLDKYAACAQHLEQNPTYSFEELKLLELGGNWKSEVCVSYNNELYKTTMDQAWQYQTEHLLSSITPYIEQADVICDLGCGYGYHINTLNKLYPNKRFVGGEYASNAVDIGKKLFEGCDNVTMQELNFFEPFSLPVSPNEKVLVMTIYALVSLPSAKKPIEHLQKIKGSTWQMCHYEPIPQWYGADLLSQLRQSYIVANDYNDDLLTIIESSPDICIDQKNEDMFGVNPLLPASFISWK